MRGLFIGFVPCNKVAYPTICVGLEDCLSIGPGKFAESNVDQIEKIKNIFAEMHLEPATPAEAREMLDIKGPYNVNF